MQRSGMRGQLAEWHSSPGLRFRSIRATTALLPRISLPLPDGNDEPVEVGGDDQSGLTARQREHRAVLIGQHDRASARRADRGASAGRGIDAIHISRRSDVADGADEIGRRGAKGKAIAHPADREWKAPAVKYQ